MKTQKLTQKEAVEKIYNTHGRIFGVEFIKRSNGELRKMSARLHVKKGVKGKGLRFDPAKKQLIPVYDMNNGFRMVSIEGLQMLRVNGQEFSVN